MKHESNNTDTKAPFRGLGVINWGWRIVIFYGSFVAFMMFLVWKTTSVNVDLVATDYYAKELEYQKQLEKQTRANKLNEQLSWEVNNKTVALKFPKEVAGKNVSANVLFYCPSDKTKDFSLVCEADANNECVMNAEKLKHGAYQMQINWNAEETSYYTEGFININ
ncbi:MAG: FixH family protein [Bacteroidota bacterium]